MEGNASNSLTSHNIFFFFFFTGKNQAGHFSQSFLSAMEPRRPGHEETTASRDHLQPVELQSVSVTQIDGTLVHFQYDIKALFPTYPRWIPKNMTSIYSCISRFPPPATIQKILRPNCQNFWPALVYLEQQRFWDSCGGGSWWFCDVSKWFQAVQGCLGQFQARPSMGKVQHCKLYFFSSYEMGHKNTQAICSCSPLSHFQRQCGPTSQKVCTP